MCYHVYDASSCHKKVCQVHEVPFADVCPALISARMLLSVGSACVYKPSISQHPGRWSWSGGWLADTPVCISTMQRLQTRSLSKTIQQQGWRSLVWRMWLQHLMMSQIWNI